MSISARITLIISVQEANDALNKQVNTQANHDSLQSTNCEGVSIPNTNGTDD